MHRFGLFLWQFDGVFVIGSIEIGCTEKANRTFVWSWIFSRFDIGPEVHKRLIEVTWTVRINQNFHNSLENLTILRVSDVIVNFKEASHDSHNIPINSRFREIKSDARNSTSSIGADPLEFCNIVISIWELTSKVSHDLLCGLLHVSDT